MTVESPLASWVPGTKLEPMQFRHLYQELRTRFQTIAELALVVGSDLGVDLDTIANGDRDNHIFMLMRWAEANNHVEVLVNWTRGLVKGSVEELIKSSEALRAECEPLLHEFVDDAVHMDKVLPLSRRMILHYAAMEVVYRQGNELYQLLHMEMERLLAAHERLIDEAVTNGFR